MLSLTLADVLFAVAGGGALLAALLPRLVEGRRPVSLPLVVLAAGLLLGLVPGLPRIDVLRESAFIEHLTEVTVIVALMGAGLGLDRPVGWRRWRNTWRLLGIAMPLTIGLVALSGSWLLGLAPATALLVGAALAPTDPVLAGEVQVGEPSDEEEQDLDDAEEEVRFSLTSEAGLNDALAFPFVYAALAVAVHGVDPGGWAGRWVALDVVLKLAVGVGVGVLVGRALARLVFSSRTQALRLSEHAEGFVAVAATFLAYGIAEVAQGYGFLAVFVAAVVIRGSERFHGYHRVMHSFVEQVERLLTVTVLLLLGVAVSGGLFGVLGWRDVVLTAGVLLVVRPLVGGLALVRGAGSREQRAAIAFFGVRGIGSLYYVAYGLTNASFPEGERAFALVSLVVVASVVLHGVTAGPVIAALDRRREAAPAAGLDPSLDRDGAEQGGVRPAGAPGGR